MRPVSLALDQLQSEEKAFMGILLPTLAMAIKKLRDVLANNEVAVCVPLITVLIDSMKKRFHEVLHCTEYELAAAIHPYFRLSWLSWLYNNDEVAVVEKESQLEMRLNNVVERQSRSQRAAAKRCWWKTRMMIFLKNAERPVLRRWWSHIWEILQTKTF